MDRVKQCKTALDACVLVEMFGGFMGRDAAGFSNIGKDGLEHITSRQMTMARRKPL
jgi:hypothetical protein